MNKPKRLFASIENSSELPSIIFFCCLHGNEKAGYLALESFFDIVKPYANQIKGNIFAIFGNKEAYLRGNRFIDKDLNRIWTKSHIAAVSIDTQVNEYHELEEIYNTLYDILNHQKSNVYCIDLHTTSGPTKPFVIMNDALNNRAFVKHLGYPVVFNAESFIEGTLMSLLNDLGHVSLAFEGGEHYSEKSVSEIEKFCFKTLKQTGIADDHLLREMGISSQTLRRKNAKYFEILYRQDLKQEDKFEMQGNYINFQNLKKGERIATLNNQSIIAPKSLQIFMPLYQPKGEDGFFYIRNLSAFKLNFARFLRQINFDNALKIVPGINKPNFYTLSIPRAIIKFVPQRLLFALGYRKSIEKGDDSIYFTKQEGKLKSLPKLQAFRSPYQKSI